MQLARKEKDQWCQPGESTPHQDSLNWGSYQKNHRVLQKFPPKIKLKFFPMLILLKIARTNVCNNVCKSEIYWTGFGRLYFEVSWTRHNECTPQEEFETNFEPQSPTIKEQVKECWLIKNGLRISVLSYNFHLAKCQCYAFSKPVHPVSSLLKMYLRKLRKIVECSDVLTASG